MIDSNISNKKEISQKNKCCILDMLSSPKSLTTLQQRPQQSQMSIQRFREKRRSQRQFQNSKIQYSQLDKLPLSSPNGKK